MGGKPKQTAEDGPGYASAGDLTPRHWNWRAVQDENSDSGSTVEIPVNQTAHIGMAITSNNPSRSTEVRMSNVKVVGNVSPDGPFTVSEDISLYSVTLEGN